MSEEATAQSAAQEGGPMPSGDRRPGAGQQPKAGDWVLVEHPFFSDSFVVREVKSVSRAMFVGLAPRARPGDEEAERSEASRALKAVRGVFRSKEEALACSDAIMPLFNVKLAEEKAAVAKFRSAVLAMLG